MWPSPFTRKKTAEKKAKAAGRPDIVHDVDAVVKTLAGTDTEELLKSVGMPDGIEYEDYEKALDLPDLSDDHPLSHTPTTIRLTLTPSPTAELV